MLSLVSAAQLEKGTSWPTPLPKEHQAGRNGSHTAQGMKRISSTAF